MFLPNTCKVIVPYTLRLLDVVSMISNFTNCTKTPKLHLTLKPDELALINWRKNFKFNPTSGKNMECSSQIPGDVQS